MKMPQISLLEWQKRYGTERACEKALFKIRWPNGFVCPRCNSIEVSYIKTRKIYQCSQCRYQVSITAGTLFHSTNLSLVKWFWVIYLTASDKGGISALRVAKHIGVSWPTARKMLKKIHTAMTDRDSKYRLEQLIEFDDNYIGGKRTGKRGRDAAGKQPILVAVETRDGNAGYMAIEAVEKISEKTVREFLPLGIHGKHKSAGGFGNE